MRILRQNQYNQGVGKYKLLSSTSGVGSIITTKLGYYILISDIIKWKFIQWANSRVEAIRTNTSDEKTVYINSATDIQNRGLNFIDDERFVTFLQQEKNLDNLVCLVGIPHMALNETFNTPNWHNHPIKSALAKTGDNASSSDFMIKGTHFPKWFKNKKGELKKIQDWFKIWETECRIHGGQLKFEHFAPPRDGTDFIRELNLKNEEGTPIKLREYRTLEQTNLVLICPNGHLSDIPWPNYLRWKTEKQLRHRPDEDNSEYLFSNEKVGPCCSNPRLKWTESKTKSEGYASIYIECQSCLLGSNKEAGKPKINLEGINNLEPFCPGEKPWEIDLEIEAPIPYEQCFVSGEGGNRREKMKIALVTANNVYYASGFSSLFIPVHLAENKSPELIEAISILNKKYQKYFDKTAISRIDYWNQKFNFADFIIENDFEVPNKLDFQLLLKTDFLESSEQDLNIDFHEHYRWQEYQCFANNASIQDNPKNNGLKFNDIELPNELCNYFIKIQQVEDLTVTNVQLDFNRVKPKERIVINGETVVFSEGRNIFSIDPKEIFVLPANETLGEGLFFQFNDTQIDNWINNHKSNFKERFSKYIDIEPDINRQGAGIKRRIFNNGIKHFLIHSFSHLLLRELEFSCGYPTASLKERLYISSNPSKTMSGILVYTAEGAEGSMGGLVSQGEPAKILAIISAGLNRIFNCSSDPLCWESDGQGIFDLNLSACFSCSLVSETACEEMNLGLDRRVLVDEKFGFFNTF